MLLQRQVGMRLSFDLAALDYKQMLEIKACKENLKHKSK